MPLTVTTRNDLIGKEFGAVDYTPPATQYIFLHLCTVLTAGASSGSTISVNDPIYNGAVTVVIDPDLVTEETFTVVSVSGSGPYTVTLDGTIAQTHLISAYVAFDLGPNGEGLLEPGDTYARQAYTNDTSGYGAASAAQVQNSNEIIFPDPAGTWGKVSHSGVADAVSAGNVRSWGPVSPRTLVNLASGAAKIPAGSIIGFLNP